MVTKYAFGGQFGKYSKCVCVYNSKQGKMMLYGFWGGNALMLVSRVITMLLFPVL